MLHEVVDFGIPQQGFCGNTAPVQADPPQGITLHQSHLHAELRSTNRCDIPTWTPSNNHHIIRLLRLSHVLPFKCSTFSRYIKDTLQAFPVVVKVSRPSAPARTSRRPGMAGAELATKVLGGKLGDREALATQSGVAPTATLLSAGAQDC